MAANLIYTIVGNKPGETSTTSLWLSDTNTLANLRGFGAAFATLLNNFITGKILSSALVFDVDISGITGNAVAETFADVEEIGAFQFVTEDGVRVSINVPAVFETAVVDLTHQLDLADARVDDLVTAIVDGIAVTGGTVNATDVGSVDIDALVFARENARPSGARRSG